MAQRVNIEVLNKAAVNVQVQNSNSINIEVLNKAAVDVQVQNSKSINIELPTAPRGLGAPFTADKTEIDQFDTVNFSASKSGLTSLFSIEDVGGFINKLGKNVSHQFLEPGNFDIALTQSDLTQQTSGVQVKRDFVKVNEIESNFLLDQLFAQGATAAYSLRLLRAQRSGGLVRIRADDNGTDKGEADVLPILQPDGSKIITLNSPIENFSGTPFSGDGYVLADLVDAGGANYDAFVSKWYDQSGNLNDASQSGASKQPQIIDAGSVIQENRRPALKANGVQRFDSLLKANEVITTAGENTTIGVFNSDSSKQQQAILGRKADPKFTILPNFNGSIIYDKGDAGGNRISVTSSGTLDQQNLALFFGNGDQTIRYNGTNLANSPTSGTINLTTNTFFLLSAENDNVFKGTVQEIILFPLAKDSEISNIETNLNKYYSIF